MRQADPTSGSGRGARYRAGTSYALHAYGELQPIAGAGMGDPGMPLGCEVEEVCGTDGV
ncbi:hypothetical protein ABZ532_28505 [Streptomyces sp. NPDC019396]|uniref:hypothetical protein n=1 Tax=Streptomyces sp. NPDC019396 TaxID=3154687 RepID=UPI0033E17523